MKFSALASATTLAAGASALSFAPYTDNNGISFYRATFDTTSQVGQWGMALPGAKQTDYASEYIGNIVGPIQDSGEGWLAVTHNSGMTNNLILLTWLEGKTIHTSFRFATGYIQPEIYSGNASLTPISQTVNETHYELTYRCENCWAWDQDGAEGGQVPKTTDAASQIMGWAGGTEGPDDRTDDDSRIVQLDSSGLMGVEVAEARNTKYTDWIKLATATAEPTATATSGGGNGTTSGVASATASATATGVACPAVNSAANTTWDYIIVGAGAGGIPLADKLSEDGSSVLLIERGPPSSGRWGGTMKPDWLSDSNLTRFDVSGLDNEIWSDSEGIACTDYSVMAGCVLGGGTAVNAGLWWRANPSDFDVNFPAGWQASDMEAAIERTFERIPFNDRPSMDGKLYKPQGYDIVAGALEASGWENVTAGEQPAAKNFTFSHPNHMFANGERGGPMATYLVTASERKNFKLVHSTDVSRVIRTSSKITGVEMSAFLKGGQCGTAKVKSTGKVILSAGAFGTPKILFRSGIGPEDQLETVQEAEPSKMVKKADWINLPVGENLDDHTNTDIVITHPDVEFYDFYAAYDDPITADKNAYLDSRSGILAQSAPNLAAFWWHEVEGDDGITRQLQWNARVEGSHDIDSKKAMTLSMYLGRGKTSRGKTTINGALNMVVSKMPYVNDENDVAAIASGIETLKMMLAKDSSIEIVYPPKNQSIDAFLAAYPDTTSSRSANHWMGSCKMGLDSGLEADGTAVVDTNAKVYGTDNLFVVDASIFPGMVTTNPSALIVAVAEHAAPLIAKVQVRGASSAGTAIVSGTATGSAGASGTGMPGPYGNATSTLVQPTGGSSVAPAATSSGADFPSHLSSYDDPSSTTSSPSSTGSSSIAPVATNPGAGSPSQPNSPASPGSTETSAAPTPPSSSPAEPSTKTPAPPSPTSGGQAPPYPMSSASSSKCTTKVTVTRSAGSAPSSGFPALGNGTVAMWGQCGGRGMKAQTACVEGAVCHAFNDYYMQCVDASMS